MTNLRATGRAIRLSLLLAATVVALPTLAGVYDSYAYKLEKGKQTKVCKHMERVYNENFQRPWDFRDLPTPTFPRLPGVEYDKRMALDLRSSAFPTSPEFEAVQWKEGRIVRDPNKRDLVPMIVAEIDINNDGREDSLVKTSFMQGFSLGHRSVSGGEDSVFILEKNQLDLTKDVSFKTFYGQIGEKRPALLSYVTLGLFARSIRPFIYDGTAYLSVYEQGIDPQGKLARETMWVLRYHEGGWNRGGSWEPVKADRVCRFRMVISN